MSDNPDTKYAILNFISTFPPYDHHPLKELDDLACGRVFAKILSTI